MYNNNSNGLGGEFCTCDYNIHAEARGDIMVAALSLCCKKQVLVTAVPGHCILLDCLELAKVLKLRIKIPTSQP